MATTKVLTLKIDGVDKAIASLGELDDVLTEVEDTVTKLGDGPGAKKAVAQLDQIGASIKDRYRDANEQVEKTIQTVANLGGSFVAAAEATQGLVGENERLAEITLKVQKVFAIVQSAQSLASAFKAATEAGNVLGRVVQALGGPLGALIVAATAIGAAMVAIVLSTDRAAAATKAFGKAMAAAGAEAEAEAIKLDVLFTNLKNTTAATNERKNAIAALEEQYGEYLPTLDLERATLEQIEIVQARVTDGVLKATKAKALQAQAEEVYAKVAEKVARQLEIRARLDELGVRNADELRRQLAGGVDAIDGFNAALSQYTGISVSARAETLGLIQEFSSLDADVNDAEAQMRRLIQASLDFSNTAPQVVAGAEAAADAISQLGEIAALGADDLARAQIEEIRQLETLLEESRQRSLARQAQYNVDLTALRNAAHLAEIEAIQETDKEDAEVAALRLARNKELQAQIAEAEAQAAEARKQNAQATMQSIIDSSVQLLGALNEFIGALGAAALQRSETAIEGLGERIAQFDADLQERQGALAELSARLATDDASQREQTIREIQRQRAEEAKLLAQKEQAQRQLAKEEAEKKKLQTQAAKREKAFRIFQILAGIPAAVVNQLAVPGIGPALAIAAAATGALQLAAAIAAPLPQFRKGGYTGDGPADQPAGVVHRGEYVVPAPIVQQPAFAPLIQTLESARTRGYQQGGMVTDPAQNLGVPKDQFAQFQKDVLALANRPVVVSVQSINETQESVRRAETRARL